MLCPGELQPGTLRLRTAEAAQAGPDAGGLRGSHVCRAGLCLCVRAHARAMGLRVFVSVCALPWVSSSCACDPRGPAAAPAPPPPCPGPAPAPPGPCPEPPVRRRDPGPCPARLTSGRCCSAVRGPGPAAAGRGRLLRPPGPSRRAGSTAPPAARGERGGRGQRSQTGAESSRTPSVSPTPLRSRNLGGT